MYKFFIIFIILSGCSIHKSAGVDDIFVPKKVFIYATKYKDPIHNVAFADTLHLSILGRPWLPAIRAQEAIRFDYFTNLDGFKSYRDPESFFRNKHRKFIEKKGRVKFKRKSVTGAISDSTYFFIHPPRSNQFRMLTYTPYPAIQYLYLQDSTSHFQRSLTIYGLGIFYQDYKVSPIVSGNNNIIFQADSVWSIKASSKLYPSKTEKTDSLNYQKFNSSLNALFTREQGFIKLEYLFDNGIEISLKLIDIIEP